MKNKHPESIQNCLKDLKKSWADLDKLSKLNENWKKLIGVELSKTCKPLKFEKNTLVISANHPQWRQALIYNKHKLKENFSRFGINLNDIKIVQNYEVKALDREKINNAKIIWENHPSRIKKNNNMVICKICNSPTPKGELSRWGKCTFCWRQNV